MITRAHIRRQLRKNGGIMNVTPRQGYFLGKLVRSIKKPFKKVLDVGKQVIKSPVGKAAIIGLGGAGLMGIGPLGSTLGGIGSRIGGGLSGLKTGLLGAASVPGAPDFVTGKGTMGLLGKLGLTKGGGSMMPTILGGVTTAGLMTYFMGKGKTEEEAVQLAQDVKRGKGLGLDLIKADVAKYRSGALSGSQMFDKGYHFLTPRNYIGAKGGRVKYQTGGVSMDKTRAENIAANKAQAAGIEGILAQGRSRLPGYTPQVATTSGGGGGGSEVIFPTSGPALDLRLEEKKQADIFTDPALVSSSTSTNIPTGKYAGAWNIDKTLVSTGENPIFPGTPGEWMYPNEAAAMGIYPRMDYEGNMLKNFGPEGIVIDGKKYYSEEEAIKDMGIERYNMFMSKGGRVGYKKGGNNKSQIYKAALGFTPVGMARKGIASIGNMLEGNEDKLIKTARSLLLVSPINAPHALRVLSGGFSREDARKILQSIKGEIESRVGGGDQKVNREDWVMPKELEEWFKPTDPKAERLPLPYPYYPAKPERLPLPIDKSQIDIPDKMYNKGGRVKYAEGPKKMNQDGLEFIVPVGQSEEKAFYDAIVNDVEGIMSDKRKDEWLKLLVPQLIKSGEMSREEKKELGFAKGGRIGYEGGGPLDFFKNLKSGLGQIFRGETEAILADDQEKINEILTKQGWGIDLEPEKIEMIVDLHNRGSDLETIISLTGTDSGTVKSIIERLSDRSTEADGGRIGLYAGGNGTPLPEDPTKPINPWAPRPKEGIKSLEAGASSIKVKGDVRPENMKVARSHGMNKRQRALDYEFENSVLMWESENNSFMPMDMQMELYNKLKKQMLGRAEGGRIGKLGGGLPRIPMGMPRVNAGGIRELDYRQSGGFVPMGVKEKADDVPAMLSKNEFVMTADAVRGAGGGSVEKGAQRMYDTMKRLEGKIA